MNHNYVNWKKNRDAALKAEPGWSPEWAEPVHFSHVPSTSVIVRMQPPDPPRQVVVWWTCEYCRRTNGVDEYVCAGCGASLPGGTR